MHRILDCPVFFFMYFKEAAPLFPQLNYSDKKSDFALIFVSLYVICLFSLLAHFKISCLSLVRITDYDVTCHFLYLFCLVCWSFWICGFIVSIKFGKKLPLFLQTCFLSFLNMLPSLTSSLEMRVTWILGCLKFSHTQVTAAILIFFTISFHFLFCLCFILDNTSCSVLIYTYLWCLVCHRCYSICFLHLPLKVFISRRLV